MELSKRFPREFLQDLGWCGLFSISAQGSAGGTLLSNHNQHEQGLVPLMTT